MMTITYDLEKSDFLNFQLYASSIDENFRKQQKKEKYRIVGITFLFACVLFFDEAYRTYSYLFLGTSVLYFIFYSWWAAWYYKRMYRQQIEQHFKGSLPYHMEVTLAGDSILINTIKGSVHFELSNISSVAEIKDYFFITENISSTAIIIPKRSLENEESVKELLSSYTDISNANYSTDMGWVWK